MKKGTVITIIVIALIIGMVMYMQRRPVENVEVETEEGTVVTQELVVTQTAVSHTLIVDDHFSLDGGVLFPFDSAVLSEDGKAIIDERTVKYRGKVQDMLDIDVVGYADSVGAEDYNQTLSVERAQAVADYIDAQTDIPHNKIIVRGKGESHADGGSAEDQALDRRVIINVTGTLLDKE
jgi:outer membrane protein OmpA-like peptidoglycan-associated protein